jgi:16S rRNA (cytosine967-C5)-methyltransferase
LIDRCGFLVLETQRLACAVVSAVAAGSNLNSALAGELARHSRLSTQQRAAITDLCYGTLRFGHGLQVVLDSLLAKPLRSEPLRWLLLIALYQLQHTRAAHHAIVDHAVRCAERIGETQAGGLVNAVLRNFLRRRGPLIEEAACNDRGRYAYATWWIDKVRAEYPQNYSAILDAGNLHPPFTLRVNRRRATRDQYLALLEEHGLAATSTGESAVTLTRACTVDRLPEFADGTVSVQDAGAQLAAPLLDVQSGMRVLDACAAPGGKTTHLLELADIEVTALDNSAARLERVRQNLARQGLQARLIAADANDTPSWWDGRPFERILADVPCSASGVVRRHPDIKWLRRAADIPQFVSRQRRMLDSLWRMLASGGKLLYTTCSIFQEENSRQIAEFLACHADAKSLPLSGVMTLNLTPEGQLQPDKEHDGFYFALLQKN